MKIAVSIPDPLFRTAEGLALKMKKSRSQLYREALTDYFVRHQPDEVTKAMNRALEQVGDQTDDFVQTAARRTLERTDW